MLVQSTKSLHPSFGVRAIMTLRISPTSTHVLRVCLTHFCRFRLCFVSLLLRYSLLYAGVSATDVVRAAPVGSVLFHMTYILHDVAFTFCCERTMMNLCFLWTCKLQIENSNVITLIYVMYCLWWYYCCGSLEGLSVCDRSKWFNRVSTGQLDGRPGLCRINHA